MTDEFKALFKPGYGQWAGTPHGRQPDYSRCCAEIADTSTQWTRWRQCARKNGHGPHGAYCKQHTPEVKAARDAEIAARRDAQYLADSRRSNLGWCGRDMVAALKAIEGGHNDPRGLAKETLDKMRSQRWWREPE